MRYGWSLFFAAIVIILGGCSSSAPISVSLSPISPQAVDAGAQFNVTATVTNSDRGVTWKLSGPGSLDSTTGSTVRFIASLTTTGQAVVTATSVADSSKSASLTIAVNPGLSIPISQTMPNGTVGAPYSAAVPRIGGTAPFQWGIYNGPIDTGNEVGGTVPDGLTLDPTTGVISGTPTAGGTWYFEATVADADGESASDGFLSLQINPNGGAANPVPFLDQSLTPTAVAPGGAGLTLTVSGANFISGVTVDWNGTALATTFVDRDHLTAQVPAANVAKAGTASVTVVNPAPGGGASNAVYFQVGAPETAVNFAAAPNSPLQIVEAFGLAAADFNQDGKPDLAVAAGAAGLYLMAGNGDGTFSVASGSPMRMPSPPFNDFASPYIGPVVVGDFTHSGYPGLATAEFTNSVAVILQGNGNGTFTLSTAEFAFQDTMFVSALAAADFNADGNLDLASANGSYFEGFVDLGYGHGAFNAGGQLYAEGFPEGVAVGDFNGDGKLDTVLAGGGSTTYPYSGYAVSLGNGDGTFTQASGSPVSLGQDLSAIVAGDFNGDGKLDLIVADGVANTVTVLLGNGNGTFQTAGTFATGNQPGAMVAGDFNNDGKLDVAVANAGDGTVTLLLGNGDGTFTEAPGSPYTVGNSPTAIAAADFNGDGKLDLAVAVTGNVSILLQQ